MTWSTWNAFTAVYLITFIHSGCTIKQTDLQEKDSPLCPTKYTRNPVYLQHPTHCQKFYICHNGVAHLQQCSSGLHFNLQINACDYPEKSGCEKDEPKGRIEEDLNSCPMQNGEHPVFLPHPTDCNKFFICDSGFPHLQVCQQGLHFNRKLKSCDYADNAGCATDNKEKPKGRIADEGDLDMCPNKNSKYPVLIPHPTECSKFFICDSGIAHPKDCQSGLHFNPKIKSCDFPSNAGCQEVSGKSEKETDESNNLNGCPAKNPKHPVYIPHPSNCGKFYICDNGTPHIKECQNGLHFNLKVKACDFPVNAGCDKRLTETLAIARAGVPSPYCPSVDGKLPIFFRSPSNCSVYYMCSHGLAYKFDCPARLHFNLRKRECDYEDEARCVPRASS